MPQPEPVKKVTQNVARILRERVELEIESLDRMYLNVYVPKLQHETGVVWFFRGHREQRYASSALMAPISAGFVKALGEYAKQHEVPLLMFKRKERKDDVAASYRSKFSKSEGVVFIGKAQEKARVFRTEKRKHPNSGVTYPWIVSSTGMVNQYYLYCQDEDFGPFFIKFCSYFPYTAKLCINGHEYLKRQLEKEGIAYEALDNGVKTCADPVRAQTIADELSAEKIDALLRKWLDILPQPFSAEDRAAGYVYDVSILQAEFSLTQVLDRPHTGRILFEQIIRDNLDLGRPDQVQLVFDRRVTKRTPGRFRTRVITHGVTPSLHFDYKNARIKQYHKEGRALRTETTINNTRDFDIGKRLVNLPALRQIGFSANRRLLDVQRISHDCVIGEQVFNQVNQPITVQGQRASGLRFGDPTVQVLLSALVLFCLLPDGFSNPELRLKLALLLGIDPAQLTQGHMTYQLRRLRLHALITRTPGTYRYHVTDHGFRIALFFSRTYAHLLRPGLTLLFQDHPPTTTLRLRFDSLDAEIKRSIERASFLP